MSEALVDYNLCNSGKKPLYLQMKNNDDTPIHESECIKYTPPWKSIKLKHQVM
jgi:hypothetical protein